MERICEAKSGWISGTMRWRSLYEALGLLCFYSIGLKNTYTYLSHVQNLTTDCCWAANCVLPITGAAKCYGLFFQFTWLAELFRFLDINWAVKETWEEICLLNEFYRFLFLSAALVEDTFSITVPLGCIFRTTVEVPGIIYNIQRSESDALCWKGMPLYRTNSVN
jgi:hypothetical protein